MNSIISKAESYVKTLFEENLSQDYTYHNWQHTMEVYDCVLNMCQFAKLSEEDTEVTLLAAIFHDIGIILDYNNHEEKSIEIAEKFLRDNNYNENNIARINRLIISTKVPQTPKNEMEEILCDSDVAHIGKKGFGKKSALLRNEWEIVKGKKYSDFEWTKSNIEFISSYKFNSKFGLEYFEKKRQKNLLKLQEELLILMADETPDTGLISSVLNETADAEGGKGKKNKKNHIEKISRGIETMFRNTMRTHVQFSSMADSKANIMISVNTMILTAIAAFMSRKLDANPHLIIPTAILTIVSLTALVMAIIVTRPVITEGVFSDEDIKEKKANLLFFGNFYRMNLDKFTWGMLEMMKDNDYLYGNMIKDFYYLGQVLGHKYKNLRMCYNIFMFGMIISVIAFAIAVVMYPNQTNLGE